MLFKMDIIFFKIAIILTFVLFFLAKQFQYYWSLFLHISIISISSIWAVQSLFSDIQSLSFPFILFFGEPLHLEIDKLSAFFILVINFTLLTGILYAKG